MHGSMGTEVSFFGIVGFDECGQRFCFGMGNPRFCFVLESYNIANFVVLPVHLPGMGQDITINC